MPARLAFDKRFLIIAPLLLLFAAGVFDTTKRKTAPVIACGTENFSGKFDDSQMLGFFEGSRTTVPSLAYLKDNYVVLGVADPDEKWIEVDLSDQIIKAWDGDSLFLESPVSTGLSWWPTPTGEFRIWTKLRATKMEGGEGKYYYNLPNVPFVMFFENEDIPGWRGFGLHGTYWHDDFGTPRSHGCVNLPTPVAEKLYYWTTPALSEGKSSVFSSESNAGTRIVIHE